MSGGTSNTGSVFVAGTSEGLPVVEEVVFNGSLAYKSSTRLFTAIAAVTTSGLANEAAVPDVEIRATGSDGSPQHTTELMISGWPAALPPQRTTWPSNSGGGRTEVDNREAIIPWSDTWTPRSGDLVRDDLGMVWEIQRAPRLAGTWVSQFWLVSLVRYEPP